MRGTRARKHYSEGGWGDSGIGVRPRFALRRQRAKTAKRAFPAVKGAPQALRRKNYFRDLSARPRSCPSRFPALAAILRSLQNCGENTALVAALGPRRTKSTGVIWVSLIGVNKNEESIRNFVAGGDLLRPVHGEWPGCNFREFYRWYRRGGSRGHSFAGLCRSGRHTVTASDWRKSAGLSQCGRPNAHCLHWGHGAWLPEGSGG